MAAPAELTDGSVPEPTEPEPPEPDPPRDAGEAGDEGAPADAGPDLVPAPSASGPGLVPAPSASGPGLVPAPSASGPGLVPAPSASGPGLVPVPSASGPGLVPAPSASGTGRASGGNRLAVAAVVVGIIALAGVAAGALAVATHGFRPKSVVQYRLAAVFSLRPGDCINSSPNGRSVTVLSCATPHDGEVFATFSLTMSSWPGTAAVQSQASSGCLSRVAGYVNPQFANAGLAQEYFYPDQLAWQAGVRTVVCEISAPAGQLTGSVRAPG